VQPDWRLCPVCGTALREPRWQQERESLEGDVRRDATGGHVAAGVLGVLVLVGIIVFFTHGGGALLASPSGSLAMILGVAVLAVVGGVIALGYTAQDTTLKTVVNTLGGVIIGVGAVALFILLACFNLFTCKGR
jgi:hypothetical protein